MQLEFPPQTGSGVLLGCAATLNAPQPLLWSHKHFGVGSQRLFAQNFRAEAFFFIKSCSTRACLFLLVIRAVVGYRCCLVLWHFITLFWELSFYVLFTRFPGQTDSNWSPFAAVGGEIPTDYGVLWSCRGCFLWIRAETGCYLIWERLVFPAVCVMPVVGMCANSCTELQGPFWLRSVVIPAPCKVNHSNQAYFRQA